MFFGLPRLEHPVREWYSPVVTYSLQHRNHTTAQTIFYGFLNLPLALLGSEYCLSDWSVRRPLWVLLIIPLLVHAWATTAVVVGGLNKAFNKMPNCSELRLYDVWGNLFAARHFWTRDEPRTGCISLEPGKFFYGKFPCYTTILCIRHKTAWVARHHDSPRGTKIFFKLPIHEFSSSIFDWIIVLGSVAIMAEIIMMQR